MLLDVSARNHDCELSCSYMHFFAYLFHLISVWAQWGILYNIIVPLVIKKKLENLNALISKSPG